MGTFYSSITLRGPDQSSVAKFLQGRSSIVSPTIGENTVVFDSVCDEQDVDAITDLTARLSREFQCPAWAVLVHDDDIFWYRLFLNGEMKDEYDSTPGYFDPNAEPASPAGGNCELLCSAFNSDNRDEVEKILRTDKSADKYTFETDRHADLVRALGLPDFVVCTAFESFERGEYPSGLSADRMMRA